MIKGTMSEGKEKALNRSKPTQENDNPLRKYIQISVIIKTKSLSCSKITHTKLLVLSVLLTLRSLLFLGLLDLQNLLHNLLLFNQEGSDDPTNTK